MTERKFQMAFVELLKNSVPAHINLAEELSSRMSMSLDSIYRRLRCETDFSLEESLQIAEQFNISLSNLIASHTNMVTFRANNLTDNTESFTNYLKILHGDLDWVRSSTNALAIYAAEDLPVFYNFFFPELARFKMCYWNKSTLNSPSFQGLSVEDVVVPSDWAAEAAKAREAFMKVSTTEIWHEDTLKSTLRQIQFYWAAGFFKSQDSYVNILNELIQLIEMVKKQAEIGKKYNPITKEFSEMDYTLYACDLMIGNNCVFLTSETKSASYLGYNTFNFIQTKNDYFNRQTEAWLNNLISKSDKVSQISEKTRNQFFKNLLSHIERLKVQIP